MTASKQLFTRFDFQRNEGLEADYLVSDEILIPITHNFLQKPEQITYIQSCLVARY
jgi:hypothetical protein